MKPALLLPPTLLVGIALGWFLKPTPNAPDPAPVAARPPAAQPTSPNPSPPLTPGLPDRPPRPAPSDLVAQPSDLVDPPDEQAELRDDAKLARLVEALSLTPEQTTLLVDSIEAARQTPPPSPETGYPGPAEIIATATAMARDVEKAIADILTPEQQSAFTELRQRIQSNRLESRTEREIAEVQETIDLSPEQRELLRQRLRETNADSSDLAQIDLVLDSSPLPLGPVTINDQGYETLRQLANSPTDKDPAATHLHLIEQQRKDLDARLARYKDILTPAQFERYQVEMITQRKFLDLMSPPQQ